MTKKLLVTGMAVLLMAVFAQAATVNITTTITAAYLPGTNTQVTPIPDITVANQSLDYRVKFSFRITDLAAGQQGFGGLAMNLGLDGLGRVNTWPANSPNFSYVDGDDVTQTVPVFSDYGDWGADINDLQGIVASLKDFGIDAADPRGTLGQAAPYDFATSFRVHWDGTALAKLNVDFYQFSVIGTDKKLTVDTNGTRLVNGLASPQALVFGANIPEPATMSLLALGGLAALIRRRK